MDSINRHYVMGRYVMESINRHYIMGLISTIANSWQKTGNRHRLHRISDEFWNRHEYSVTDSNTSEGNTTTEQTFCPGWKHLLSRFPNRDRQGGPGQATGTKGALWSRLVTPTGTKGSASAEVAGTPFIVFRFDVQLEQIWYKGLVGAILQFGLIWNIQFYTHGETYFHAQYIFVYGLKCPQLLPSTESRRCMLWYWYLRWWHTAATNP